MKMAMGWLVLLGGALAAVVLWRAPVVHWAQGEFGFRTGDSNSTHYLFWSGIGSDLAYLSIIGGAVIYYRKENCRARWCPFIGHHPLTDKDGVVRKLCALHHPDVIRKTLTRADIHRMHQFRQKHPLFYLGDKPGKG